MDIQITCKYCNIEHQVSVPDEQHQDWKNGTPIQNAMPDVSESDRELLISGCCDKCWISFFGEDEEVEDDREEIIENVLLAVSDEEINLSSKSAREYLAKKIAEEI